MSDVQQIYDSVVDRIWFDGLKAIDEQYEEAEASRRRWVRIGHGLLVGRRRCPADQDFGDWLDTTGYRVINRDERQDAMWLAFNEDVALRALSETRIGNPSWARRYIREILSEVYCRCRDVSVTETSVTDSAIGQLTEKPQEEAPVTPPEQTAISAPTTTTCVAPARRETSGVIKRSPFYGRERAAEVQAIYRSSNTRGYIGRILRSRGGSDIWPMILSAIDEGFLTENNYQAYNDQTTLRVLFPDERAAAYCRGIDLTTAQARKQVKAFILPLMIENKDAILANPAQIAQIMHRAEYQARLKAGAGVAAERIAAMPQHESEITIYGERFWPNPNPDIRSYSYDQCCAACWYFHETDQLHKGAKNGDDVKGRAMLIRFSTRWFSQYADRELNGEAKDKIKRVFQLVHAMANAMQQNPAGESKRPPAPTNDGEWS